MDAIFKSSSTPAISNSYLNTKILNFRYVTIIIFNYFKATFSYQCFKRQYPSLQFVLEHVDKNSMSTSFNTCKALYWLAFLSSASRRKVNNA